MKHRYRQLAALLILSLLLAGCNQQAQSQQDIYRYQSFAFGTLIEIKIRSDDKPLSDSAAAELFSDFDRLHKDWHAWQPGLLTQTSALLQTGKWFTADSSLLPLIKLSKLYSSQSNQLFNPVIGNLIQAWGFQSDEMPSAPPDRQTLDSLLQNLPTVDDIEINGEQLRGRNPQLQLDLGAIAKGYAIVEGLKALHARGLDNILINAGGDLCGSGDQGQRAWRIGIRNPSEDGIIASVELNDNECVFTSGDYERYFDYEGKRYHHIIDPRNGYPANAVVSVTVLHSDGALADAASTALFIAGPDDWQQIAKAMGVSDVMLIDKQGQIIMTPSMQKRITLEDGNADRKIIINQPGD